MSTSRKSTLRRRTIVASAAAVAAVGTTVALLPGAEAAGPSAPAKLSPQAMTATAAHLQHTLGSAAAGTYIEHGKLVVNTVGGRGAEAIKQAGAVPHTVTYSSAQLQAATRTLGKQAKIPGTAWMVDPKTNTVRVLADRTVTGSKLDKIHSAVQGLGGKATFKQTSGKFNTLLAGGDAIYGGGVRCSLGFNVKVGGKAGFLTAGHCGNAAQNWSDSQSGSPLATTSKSKFPGNDYSLATYDDASASAPSEVDLYNGSTQKITKAGDATVGEKVTRSGSTSQVHDGTVKALNATVNYQEGSVSGLIDTDVCAEPGDSGGALFDGETALGLTSGGSGDCSAGGETFFQPVPAALSAVGATIG